MTASDPQLPTPPRRLWPRWPGLLLITAGLITVAAVQWIRRLDDPPRPFNDPAVCNLVTLIAGFTACFTLWIWAVFLSSLALRVRRGLLVATAGALVTFFAAFRFVEVSGNMIPRFAPRWQAIPDRALARQDAASGAERIEFPPVTEADFPGFLGPERTNWLPDRGLAADWSGAQPRRMWKQPIGAGWSGFAAVGDYAVTLEQRGDEEWISCYAIADGSRAWAHAIAGRHENPLGGIGPRSTPTIHEGRVYALGATGVLRCLDGATGALLWKDDLRARYGLSAGDDEALVMWGRAGSPLVADSLVVVPGGGPAGKAKNLVAFDVASGRLVWESEVPVTGGADQIAYASPRLATVAGVRQILITNENTVSGHDPARGALLWSHPWPGQSNGAANSSQVVPIDDRQLLISKGYSQGAELIELQPSENGTLAARTVWKNSRVLQTKFTNIVVINDHAYGLSEGILECVELASGKRKWKQGRYGHGQILGVGERILVLAEDGRLALVAADTNRFSELGSLPALTGKTWNNVCLAGKRLLIRNGEEAACFELP